MNRSERPVILFNPRNIRAVGEDCSPPMGILMASIHLHENFRVVILDQRVDANWKKQLLALLKKNPICFAVTAQTGRQIYEGLRASEIAKKNKCPVIWGGIHASLLPAQTISHRLVDYVVQGEGEETFAELVQALASGSFSKGIPGVWSKEGNQPIFGGARPFVDLNKLPHRPYQLINFTKYIKNGRYGKTVILYTSRGCPQRCTFCCNWPLHRSRWRAFSSERVLREIEWFRKKYPALSHFEFWDNNFFASLSRAGEIAEGFKKMGPSVTWSVIGAHVHDVSRMDDDYLSSLRDSGLKEILVGVESGSQKIINFMQKNFTLNQLFSLNKRVGDYDIGLTYSFMSGIPEEDDDDIKKTIDVILRLKKENPRVVTGNVKPFVCYPGTGLYKKSLEQGFNPPKRLEDWGHFVWGNYLNFEISSVSPKRKRLLTWLYYYTILMNPEYVFIRSRISVFIVRLLCPIAQWRVRRLCFKFPIEAWFMHKIQKFFL